jgi:hypothetical protein
MQCDSSKKAKQEDHSLLSTIDQQHPPAGSARKKEKEGTSKASKLSNIEPPPKGGGNKQNQLGNAGQRSRAFPLLEHAPVVTSKASRQKGLRCARALSSLHRSDPANDTAESTAFYLYSVYWRC